MEKSLENLVQEAREFAKKLEYVKFPIEPDIRDNYRRKLQYFDECFWFHGKQTDDFVDFSMLRYMISESPFMGYSQCTRTPIDTVDDNGYRFPAYEASYEEYVREVQMGCYDELPF